MDLLQTLFVLGMIVLIVWWALRRGVKESEKEAPVGHSHEDAGEHEAHVERADQMAPVSVIDEKPDDLNTFERS